MNHQFFYIHSNISERVLANFVFCQKNREPDKLLPFLLCLFLCELNLEAVLRINEHPIAQNP